MSIYGGTRGIAQVFIKGAATRGLSANATLDMLRDAGLGYRRTDFLTDYRTYHQVEEVTNRLKYTPKTYQPGRALYKETEGVQLNRYMYQVDIEIKKPGVPGTTTFSTNVATDKRLTIGQAEEEAIRAVKWSFGPSEIEIKSYHTERAWHKAGEPWD